MLSAKWQILSLLKSAKPSQQNQLVLVSLSKKKISMLMSN